MSERNHPHGPIGMSIESVAYQAGPEAIRTYSAPLAVWRLNYAVGEVKKGCKGINLHNFKTRKLVSFIFHEKWYLYPFMSVSLDLNMWFRLGLRVILFSIFPSNIPELNAITVLLKLSEMTITFLSFLLGIWIYRLLGLRFLQWRESFDFSKGASHVLTEFVDNFYSWINECMI